MPYLLIHDAECEIFPHFNPAESGHVVGRVGSLGICVGSGGAGSGGFGLF
jgi:hypothetical protein